jgi:protein ImuA
LYQASLHQASWTPVMSSVAPAETLHALRRVVADLSALPGERARLIRLGVPSLDQALCGGLACAALHEISPAQALHGGAATGFALVLLALALGGGEGAGGGCSQTGRGYWQAGGGHRRAVWIQPDFTAAEAGDLYGSGLDLIGLPMDCLIILRVPHPRDALWAMEEALKCRAAGAVVADLASAETDLTTTRRLALAAHEGGGLGLILCPSACARPSTAMTRWEVQSARGERDRFGGLGPATFALLLVKNRRGRTGQWRLSWNHHERAFAVAALPVPMAPAARDGSPPRVCAG